MANATGLVTGIGGIAVVIIILIVIFRKFDIGTSLTNARKGISDFFNSISSETSKEDGTKAPNLLNLDGSTETFTKRDADGTRTTTGDARVDVEKNLDGTTTTTIGGNLAITSGKLSAAELEKARANRDFSLQDELLQLDPTAPDFQAKARKIAEGKGVSGFDEIQITDNDGIKFIQLDRPDEPFDIGKSISEGINNLGKSISEGLENMFPNIPVANAELAPAKQVSEQTEKSTPVIRDKDAIIAVAKQRFEKRKQKRDREREKSIKPDYSRSTFTGLLEGETASERANRIFENAGRFADEKRLESANKVTRARDVNFNFGTNTGSGRKEATVYRGGERGVSKKGDRRALLEAEASKARKIFNSRDISNW